MSTPQTPMMRQYQAIKDGHQGFLLFYRMGDFYELFGEDALTASNVLQITLTRRRTAKEGDEGVPMCGVPFHAAEGYIAKLLKAGHKVALCDQVETPEEAKKRGGSSALVKREVTRLFTNGTLTEDALLEADQSNYLAALADVGGDMALAWLELSTGECYVEETDAAGLPARLARINPQELVLSENLSNTHATTLAPYARRLTTHSPFVDVETAEKILEQTFNTQCKGFTKSALRALGGVVDYAKLTQMGSLPALNLPQHIESGGLVEMDAATRRNLELTQTLNGSRKGSLMSVINHTVTAAGSRLLAQWIEAPLNSLAPLQARQQAIQFFQNNIKIHQDVRATLKQTADLSRALSRLTLGRGGPRDVHALRVTLKAFPSLIQTLQSAGSATLINQNLKQLEGFEKLTTLLDNALAEEDLPMLARDGGYIRKGHCGELDKYLDLSTNGLQALQKLERQEAERIGVSSLKIKYNKVWGYFFEVTKSNLAQVPDDFIHRQTTTNASRFSTPDLMQLERDISAAKQNSLAREQEIFKELVDAITAESHPILQAAKTLAELDVLAAGTELAKRSRYTFPTLKNDNTFNIEQGRHPVVATTTNKFIPNNAALSGGKLWLLTGPNMAGKSTFLRQNALITILAQIGYPIPAKSAEIGLVDKIFTRIGASDDLAAGRSTFMVEMVEAANILSSATAKSLVVLDEIGRGTATYDGLAIAWACVEHLVSKIGCRGLFATHYHELTHLTEQHKNLSNHHVAAKEWKGDIVFLHEVKEGAAPGSYGVHVARLAGLPTPVLNRADEILKGLEKASRGTKPANPADLPLFTSTPAPAPATAEPSAVEQKIEEVDLDSLSPREAQSMLYELRSLIKQGAVN